MQVTVVVPTGKVDPDGGEQLVVTPGQLSVAVVVKLTTALLWPGAAVVTMSVGQVIVGGWVSLIVTGKLQLLVLPLASVTVNRLVVVPFAKVAPLGNPAVCVTVAPGQLSLEITV